MFGWDIQINLEFIWILFNLQKSLNIEKIKVVQIKSLAMHITNQKLRFDIVMVINL